MRKKVLSLTLVAAMMAGCLAGCGNADSKDEGTTAAAGDSTTQAAASDDAIQNLIDATTGTVDLSVWASEEDQDLTTQVIEEFKKNHKATCCRVLTAGLDMASPERKAHCTNMVNDCSKILEEMIKVKV